MDDTATIVIVGAGPAGLAAARALVEAGLRPIVIEEASQPGGQGTRRLSPLTEPHREALFGKAADAMARREAAEDALLRQRARALLCKSRGQLCLCVLNQALGPPRAVRRARHRQRS